MIKKMQNNDGDEFVNSVNNGLDDKEDVNNDGDEFVNNVNNKLDDE